MAEARKPLPHPTPETQPFWDGTKAGELHLQDLRMAVHASGFNPRRMLLDSSNLAIDLVEALYGD